MDRDLPVYVLEREFDAPRELVWRAWTDPALLPRWYGPRVETVIHRLDLRPGGLWLLEMRRGGRSSYQRAEYLDIVAPARLAWLHANADAEWNVAASAMMPDWPRLLLTTVTLGETRRGTSMRLTWEPHEASAAEIACFAAALAGLDQGWAAGMELMAAMLVELQAA